MQSNISVDDNVMSQCPKIVQAQVRPLSTGSVSQGRLVQKSKQQATRNKHTVNPAAEDMCQWRHKSPDEVMNRAENATLLPDYKVPGLMPHKETSTGRICRR